jgi:hypothetical protein
VADTFQSTALSVIEDYQLSPDNSAPKLSVKIIVPAPTTVHKKRISERQPFNDVMEFGVRSGKSPSYREYETSAF